MQKVLKYTKRFFIIFTILLSVITIALFLLLKYRLNETLSFIVNKESNGCYDLKIGKSKLDFSNKYVKLKNVTLSTQKCKNLPIRKIKIDEIELQISSFLPILTRGNIDIQKMHIKDPKLSVHLEKSKKKVNFKEVLAKIHTKLASIGGKFKLKDFKIIHADLDVIQGKNRFKLDDLNINIDHYQFNNASQTFDASYDIYAEHQKINLGSKIIKLDGFTLTNNLGLSLKQINILTTTKFDIKLKNTFSAQNLNLKINPSFFNNKGFIIDELKIDDPDLILHRNKRDSIQVKKINFNDIFALFDFVEIKNAIVNNMDIQLPKTSFHQNEIQILQKSFQLKSLYANEKEGVSCQFLELEQDSITISSKEKTQFVSFNQFRFENSTITILNPSIQTIDIKLKKRANLIQMDAIQLYQLDIAQALNKKYIAKKISILNPKIDVNKFIQKENNKISIEKINQTFSSQISKIKNIIQVDELAIENGHITYLDENKKERIKANGVDLIIDTKKIEAVPNIKSIHKSIKFFNCQAFSYHSHKNEDVFLEAITLDLKRGNYVIKNLKINSSKMKGELNELSIHSFDLKNLLDSQKVNIDKIKVQSLNLSLQENQKSKNNTTSNKKIDFSALRIDTIQLQEINIKEFHEQKLQYAFGVNHLFLTEFKISNKLFEWKELKAKINEIYVHNDSKKIGYNISSIEVNNNIIQFNDLALDINNKNNITSIDLPQLIVSLPNNSIDLNRPHIQQILFPNTQIGVKINKNEKEISNETLNSQTKIIQHIPSLRIDEISLSKNNVTLDFKSKEEQIHSEIDLVLNFKNVVLEELNNFTLSKENLTNLPLKVDLNFSLAGKIADSKFKGNHFSCAFFELKNEEGINFKDAMSFIDKPYLVGDYLSFSAKNLMFKNKTFKCATQAIDYTNSNHNLALQSLQFKMNQSKEDYLNSKKYQSLYAEITQGDLMVENISFKDIIEQKKYHIPKIELRNIVANLSKDKTKPFEHNIIKPMLTDFFMNYHYDFMIKEIKLINDVINYDEKSEKTGKIGQMSFTNMNGSIKNITSKPSATDSLEINASLNFEEVPIHKFIYMESYIDTLSAFRYEIMAGKTDLQKLSKITEPLISLEIIEGKCESLHTKIRGNKYASIGYMRFKYHDLEIKLDSNQRIRSNFLLKIVNFAANDLVLNRKNRKSSKVFFVRDQEKFIINLWVKSLLSGIYTSVGLKKDKKYYKEYKEIREEYYLPKKY